jgi:multiple sugar transport system substrate-binding protein
VKRFFVGGLTAVALVLLSGTADAATLRIALHGQAGLDAFKSTAAAIEKDSTSPSRSSSTPRPTRTT